MRTVRNIIFIVFANIFFRILNIFTSPKKEQALLIVKIDAIGDYIISRNFIEIIKNNSQFIGNKVILIGNELWKDISEELEKEVVDYFIFLKPVDFRDNILKQIKLLVKLREFSIQNIVNLHHSRNPLSEIICCSIPNTRRYGIEGSSENSSRLLFSFSTFFYKNYKPKVGIHEFDIYKDFSSFILEMPILIESPYFKLKPLGNYNAIKSYPYLDNYIVIAHGAGVSDRILEDSKMLDLVSHIYNKTNHEIVFIGTSSDSRFPQKVESILKDNHRIVNLTGKTTLILTASIIKNSIGVVCYDSGIYHMAVALDKKLICIAGGGHFNRFVNYSVKKKNSFILFNDTMSCFNCSWICTKGYIRGTTYPCVSNAWFDNAEIIDKFLSA